MKRKFLSALMVAVLLTLVLCLTSCGIPSMMKMRGAEYSFEYSSCFVSPTFNQLKGTLSYLYEDTTLRLYDDGTWTIDMDDPSIFVDNTLDKGTFTLDENGTYSFEGFEYDLETTGEMNENGFSIYFKDPTGIATNAFVIHFKN